VLGAGGARGERADQPRGLRGAAASVLSLFSFVLQIGGLIASACGYAVSARADFRTMWWISGALLLLGSGVFAALRARKHSEHAAVTSGKTFTIPSEVLWQHRAKSPETSGAGFRAFPFSRCAAGGPGKAPARVIPGKC
jgi:hypothetical protein